MNNQGVKVSSHGFKWQWITEDEIDTIRPLKLAFAMDASDGKKVFDDLTLLNENHEVELLPSSPYFIEMVNRGVSKGNGVLGSIEALGYQDKTVICVGDYLNDLSMLNIADYGFVIQNGHPDLKKLFPVLKSSHNECMMAEMLKIIDDLE